MECEDDKFCSAIVSGSYNVTYTVGEWVEAPIGKLFVFKELKDAHSFIGKTIFKRNFKIFKCETGKTKKMERCAQAITPSITKFWKKKTAPYQDLKAPKGTYGTNKIKLVEEV